MIQPIDNMGTDNVPTKILNTIGDKSVQLDADALRLNIDLLGLPKNVIIDGTSFTRYNTATGITYTASWDTLHLRLLHTIAVQPNPNSTTMSVNDTLNLTTGIARNFDLKMNGTNAEATSTGQLLIQSADTMNLTTTGVANMNLTSAGGTITTNGATMDMGAGRTIEQASITGVSGVPLEVIANPTAGDIILTTNTDQDTTQDSQGNLKQTNKQGLNNFPVGSLYTGGIRGRQLQTTGGSAGYGDFITYSFIVGQMNDGRGHNFTRGMGLNTGFEVFDWGANPGFIQSFGCRMVATLPDANTFICPVILADLPSGIPEINYDRITYYGNTNQNPFWVNEGQPTGVQCPAVQVNRFYGGSQVVVEWSCSFVYNNTTAQLLAPLSWKCNIIGVDSSQEPLRAEVIVNWLNHPVPQATALRPCLVFENGVGAWNSIESAEMWANGCPFGA